MSPSFASILSGLDTLEAVAVSEGLATRPTRLQYYRDITQGLLEASGRNEADRFAKQHGLVHVLSVLTEAHELAGITAFLLSLPFAVRRDRISAILDGAASLARERSTCNRPRNIAFELHLAGRLASKGIPVELTPTIDIVAHHPLGTVFIQCKRPFVPHKYEKLGRKAFHQLERDLAEAPPATRGLIAISVSRLVNPRGSAFGFQQLPALSQLGTWLHPFRDKHLRFWASLRHPQILGGILHLTVPVFMQGAPEPLRLEERGLAVPFFSAPAPEHFLHIALIAAFSSRNEVSLTLPGA